MSKTTTHPKQKLAIYVPKSRTEQLQSIGLSGQTVHVTIPSEVEDLAAGAAALDGMSTEEWIVDTILQNHTACLESHAGDARALLVKIRAMNRGLSR
jgi:hypothetical protein